MTLPPAWRAPRPLPLEPHDAWLARVVESLEAHVGAAAGLPADTWDAGRDAAAAKLRDMAERMRASVAHDTSAEGRLPLASTVLARAHAATLEQAADAVAQLQRSPLQHCRCGALWHGEECACDREARP